MRCHSHEVGIIAPSPCGRSSAWISEVGLLKFIMLNSTFFARGSIHQGNNRFSDVSRGRHCYVPWTTEAIDGILIEGNVMYLKAFEERSIPDEETISLNYLPDRVLSSTISTAIETEPKHNQTIDLCQQPNIANTYQNESPNAAQNRKQTSNETNTKSYQNALPNAAQNQKLTPNMVKKY